MSDRIRCDYCKEITEEGQFAQDLGGEICEFCAEELTMKCSECGERALTEDLTEGDNPLCQYCNYAATRRA